MDGPVSAVGNKVTARMSESKSVVVSNHSASKGRLFVCVYGTEYRADLIQQSGDAS